LTDSQTSIICSTCAKVIFISWATFGAQEINYFSGISAEQEQEHKIWGIWYAHLISPLIVGVAFYTLIICPEVDMLMNKYTMVMTEKKITNAASLCFDVFFSFYFFSEI
jgi:hypothetical protein